MNSTDSRRGNESARPLCLPNTFLSPSFAPSRGRRVSLGGGSFSSHVTEEKRTGLQPGIPPLCGTAIPGRAPFFVAQPFLAVRLSPHLASIATPSGFSPAFPLFVAQPLLAVLRSSSSRLSS